MKTIVGLYEEMSDARQVVQELTNAGLDRDRISLVAGDSEGRYSSEVSDSNVGDNVAGGATTGAVVGGLGGLLLGLGALAIPGIGPVIAAGPIVSALVGAGVGAAVGGLVGALTEVGVPEEQAGYYAEGVRRGSTLVTVEAPEHRVDEVVTIMNRYNPINVDERASTWRQSGWTGYSADDDSMTTTPSSGYSTSASTTRTTATTPSSAVVTDDDKAKFEVVEEEVRVGKREVDRGGVRVHTRIDEIPVEEQVRLREERINVERHPVDRPASSADFQSFREGTLEVTATAEEAVVQKEARVVEEVVIDKDVQERTETIHDTVRRKDVEVEQVGGSSSGGYDQYSTGFRNHWQTNYANSGYTYEQYEPAYRYGSTLASDTRYQGRDWNAIEADARRDWSQRYQDSPWEKFKDAVRNGWERTKDAVR